MSVSFYTSIYKPAYIFICRYVYIIVHEPQFYRLFLYPSKYMLLFLSDEYKYTSLLDGFCRFFHMNNGYSIIVKTLMYERLVYFSLLASVINDPVRILLSFLPLCTHLGFFPGGDFQTLGCAYFEF